MLHLPDAAPSGRFLRPDFCGERRNRHAPWYNICSADIIPYFPKKQRDNCYLFFSLRENCSWSGRSVSLSCDLYQSQGRHVHQDRFDRICRQTLAQPSHKLLILCLFLHIDEIHHNDPGKISEPQLNRDLLGRLQIRFQVRFRSRSSYPCFFRYSRRSQSWPLWVR